MTAHSSLTLERVKRLGHFVAAGKLQALVQIVRGQGLVVGALLIQETVEFFTVSCSHVFTLMLRLAACRRITTGRRGCTANAAAHT